MRKAYLPTLQTSAPWLGLGPRGEKAGAGSQGLVSWAGAEGQPSWWERAASGGGRRCCAPEASGREVPI